ncbi:hypothetical protein ACFE04_028165 [Oxalis oulophora]
MSISPPSTTDVISENDLQPFFVMHKASSKKKKVVTTTTTTTRRKIDLSSSSSPVNKSEDEDENEEQRYHYSNLRMQAFDVVWSTIDATIKDVLRDINSNVFHQVLNWVRDSFDTITSYGKHDFHQPTRPFPIVTDATSTQLFTGFVLTKNMEFVDNLLTFEELGLHLKSQGCYVANLSSLDFSPKNGIAGCIRSLLRQFVKTAVDAADISILASWYGEQRNSSYPVIVVIDDIERCCGSVLSDFILMLSEWVVKLPVILIMGVATTLDSPREILRSNALQRLSPCKFVLGTPAERMDAIIEGVLVKQCSGFVVSHKVATFLRNHFVNQDGTTSSFIRGLKIACVQHFSMEPLSFIIRGFFSEGNQVLGGAYNGLLSEAMLKHAFDLPSVVRNNMINVIGEETLELGLLKLKKLQNYWSVVVMILYEAGKYEKIQLLDLLCETLDPEFYNSLGAGAGTETEIEKNSLSSDRQSRQYLSLRKGGVIFHAVRRVRDLSLAELSKLVKRWEELSKDATEIHDKVKELGSLFKCEDDINSKQDVVDISSKRSASRFFTVVEKEGRAINEKAATLLANLVRDHMQPIECTPFHEIVCFNNVDKLKSALIGDPRRRIQVDLLESHNILQCSCCSRIGSSLLPSKHDSSIMYALAQEHGDLINLHDWYETFKSTISICSKKKKQKSKCSPSPKKRKKNEAENLSNAVVQARFCRAVTELQITGLLRMPTKRRPDFVQRVAFGL